MKELVDQIKAEYAAFVQNADAQVEKGNKAAGARARKAALNLMKLMKDFRKAKSSTPTVRIPKRILIKNDILNTKIAARLPFVLCLTRLAAAVIDISLLSIICVTRPKHLQEAKAPKSINIDRRYLRKDV